MKKDVKIRVLFKPGKSKRECKPLSLLGELMQTERMELAVQSIMAENLYHIHDKSQNRSVALMSGLIQNQCDKGWTWIKGIIGRGPLKGKSHYWLECDGWAVESADVPGSLLTEPHAILVMEADMYRKELKLKAMATRKPKQVTQWLLKQKKKRTSAMQDTSAPSKSPVAPKAVMAPTDSFEHAKKDTPTQGSVPPASESTSLETVARELVAMGSEEKTTYKDRLMEVMTTLKKEGITPTRIATVFLKEKTPTRSGRGLWNPRMVGEIFKQIEE